MKYFTFLAVTAIIFTWMACGHGRPVNESETTGTTQQVGPTNSTTQSQTVPTQSQTIPLDLNSQTTVPTVIPAGTTTAGLNPEHGQPGHRCDIAVGAPLNSKPTAAATVAPQAPAVSTPTVTSPFTISPDKPSQPATTTAVTPGMNPEHGKPGHRCDIAVGAALDSKPAQPAGKETTPINISPDQPAKTDAQTVVAPGMNPAHGQPGHRCDIAVGAPLNSKPSAAAVIPQSPANNQIIPSVVPIKPTQDTKKNNR